MLFSTPLFVFCFLPIVLGLTFASPRRLRNTTLLLASLWFYAWGEPAIVLVMLASILANFGFGLWVDGSARGGRSRALALAAAVVFDLGLLVLFKYADWLVASLGDVLVALGLRAAPLASLGSHLAADSPWRAFLLGEGDSIRLPIGISFFTFQALSYVIDVHRRDAPVQRNPLDLALYVALFPQLIAGPIVRYRDVAEQLSERAIRLEGFAYGVRRLVLGLGKKMLIANACAEAADGIFGTGAGTGIPVAELTPALAWLATVAYTLQIYFDFSGYSDMAVGLGHMLGFRFRENFEYPYVADSITSFWRRWHVSLSSWFRDYLYIPLGGNRGGRLQTYRNLVLVFALCGLWHGANLTFLVWGLYHGAFLVLERGGLGAWIGRRAAVLRHAYTLLAVMVGWVFFRAESVAQASGVLAALFGLGGGAAVPVGEQLVAASAVHPIGLYATPVTWIAIAAGVVGSAPWLPVLVRRLEARRARGTWAFAFAAGAGLVALALLFLQVALALASGSYNPFIYFRF